MNKRILFLVLILKTFDIFGIFYESKIKEYPYISLVIGLGSTYGIYKFYNFFNKKPKIDNISSNKKNIINEINPLSFKSILIDKSFKDEVFYENLEEKLKNNNNEVINNFIKNIINNGISKNFCALKVIFFSELLINNNLNLNDFFKNIYVNSMINNLNLKKGLGENIFASICFQVNNYNCDNLLKKISNQNNKFIINQNNNQEIKYFYNFINNFNYDKILKKNNLFIIEIEAREKNNLVLNSYNLENNNIEKRDLNSFKDIKDRGHLILAYKEKDFKYKTIDLDNKNKLTIIDMDEYIKNYPKDKDNSVCYINTFPYQRQILNIKTIDENLSLMLM